MPGAGRGLHRAEDSMRMVPDASARGQPPVGASGGSRRAAIHFGGSPPSS